MSVTSPPLAISTGIGTLLIRQLDSSDGADLQALCQRCHDYFELVTGHPVGPAEAQSLFSSLPEGKTYEDKFLLGVFRGSAGSCRVTWCKSSRAVPLTSYALCSSSRACTTSS